MLHYIERPQENTSNTKQHILYWKLSINFPNIVPLEFKVASIKQLADVLGIKETTLRKIVYSENYNSKRYGDFLKHVTLTPHYE